MYVKITENCSTALGIHRKDAIVDVPEKYAEALIKDKRAKKSAGPKANKATGPEQDK